jgi:hypothetical protein
MNSANIDGAVSSYVIGYFRQFYSLRPCIEVGYMMDTKQIGHHDPQPAVSVLKKKVREIGNPLGVY